MHRQLAGLGDEEIASDADEVAVIEQAEKLPAINVAAGRLVASAYDILPAHVNLQTRRAVGQMNKRGLAHHARRRGDASGQRDANLLQFGVRGIQRFRRSILAFINLRLQFPKCGYDRSNRIFASRRLGDVAALKLVRIDVAYKAAQSVEMLVSRAGLIVLFDERDRHKNS